MFARCLAFRYTRDSREDLVQTRVAIPAADPPDNAWRGSPVGLAAADMLSTMTSGPFPEALQCGLGPAWPRLLLRR